MNLKQRAKQIKQDVPVVFLAFGKREVPIYAKLIIAIAIMYALSPVDLIPDFIPILGLLDDIIILPFLIFLAFKLIPNEVILECREESLKLTEQGLIKKWYYAIPIILIWLGVVYLIISYFVK
jgi:uncharacterized membrane protein YkvA (DUF1232 family)